MNPQLWRFTGYERGWMALDEFLKVEGCNARPKPAVSGTFRRDMVVLYEISEKQPLWYINWFVRGLIIEKALLLGFSENQKDVKSIKRYVPPAAIKRPAPANENNGSKDVAWTFFRPSTAYANRIIGVTIIKHIKVPDPIISASASWGYRESFTLRIISEAPKNTYFWWLTSLKIVIWKKSTTYLIRVVANTMQHDEGENGKWFYDFQPSW